MNKLCDRADGRRCQYWRRLYRAKLAPKICYFMLTTGKSNTWENPCPVFEPFTGKTLVAFNGVESESLSVEEIKKEMGIDEEKM